jgi:hypothetical protein
MELPGGQYLLPSGEVILPIWSTHTVKSTETDSLWELQVWSCANGARMIEGIHYDQYFATVAILDSICIVLIIGSAQGKQAYILDIGNAFHNTIEFDSSKRTYITLPPFFVEYLQLHWATYPGLVPFRVCDPKLLLLTRAEGRW